MEKFNEVLDIEKKYNSKISKIQKNVQKDFDLKKENILIEEEAIKLSYKKQLNEDISTKTKSYQKQAQTIIEEAKEDSKRIRTYAKIKEAKELILEAIKNV